MLLNFRLDGRLSKTSRLKRTFQPSTVSFVHDRGMRVWVWVCLFSWGILCGRLVKCGRGQYLCDRVLWLHASKWDADLCFTWSSRVAVMPIIVIRSLAQTILRFTIIKFMWRILTSRLYYHSESGVATERPPVLDGDEKIAVKKSPENQNRDMVIATDCAHDSTMLEQGGWNAIWACGNTDSEICWILKARLNLW